MGTELGLERGEILRSEGDRPSADKPILLTILAHILCYPENNDRNNHSDGTGRYATGSHLDTKRTESLGLGGSDGVTLSSVWTTTQREQDD